MGDRRNRKRILISAFGLCVLWFALFHTGSIQAKGQICPNHAQHDKDCGDLTNGQCIHTCELCATDGSGTASLQSTEELDHASTKAIFNLEDIRAMNRLIEVCDLNWSKMAEDGMTLPPSDWPGGIAWSPDRYTDKRIIHVSLFGTDIAGRLDISELNNLGALKSISLSEVAIDGELADIKLPLDKLSLYETSFTGELRDLPPTLTELHLFDADLTGTFRDLPEGLIVLNLNSVNKNMDIKGSLRDLNLLTRLNKITLYNLDISGNLSDLHDLSGLQRLVLQNVKVAGCFNDLKDCDMLELCLDHVDVSGKLEDLQVFKNLEDIRLSHVNVSGRLRDLGSLTKLTVVSLRGMEATGTLRDLYSLPGLITVDFENVDVTGQLSDLNHGSYSAQMNSIGLIQMDGITGSLADLKDFKRLQTIFIENTPVTGEIKDIQGLTRLICIIMRNTGVKGSLKDFEPLYMLNIIQLAGQEELTGDLSDLSGLKYLNNLRLNNMQVMGDTSALSHHSQFYDVDLSELKIILPPIEFAETPISVEVPVRDFGAVIEPGAPITGGVFDPASGSVVWDLPAQRSGTLSYNFNKKVTIGNWGDVTYSGTVIQPYTRTGIIYIPRTLVDDSTGVRVTGSISDDAVLEVKKAVLHEKGACDACDAIRSLQDKGSTLAAYDLSLSLGSYQEISSVEIPVGKEYDGEQVTVLHCKDMKLESQSVTVQEGMAQGNFTGLSPYVVVKPDHSGGANGVQTGDSADICLFLLLMASSSLIVGALSVCRRKRNADI